MFALTVATAFSASVSPLLDALDCQHAVCEATYTPKCHLCVNGTLTTSVTEEKGSTCFGKGTLNKDGKDRAAMRAAKDHKEAFDNLLAKYANGEASGAVCINARIGPTSASPAAVVYVLLQETSPRTVLASIQCDDPLQVSKRRRSGAAHEELKSKATEPDWKGRRLMMNKHWKKGFGACDGDPVLTPTHAQRDHIGLPLTMQVAGQSGFRYPSIFLCGEALCFSAKVSPLPDVPNQANLYMSYRVFRTGGGRVAYWKMEEEERKLAEYARNGKRKLRLKMAGGGGQRLRPGPGKTVVPPLLGPWDEQQQDRNMAHNSPSPLPVPGSNGTRFMLVGGLGVFRGAITSKMVTGLAAKAAGVGGGDMDTPEKPLTLVMAEPNSGIFMTTGPGWAFDPHTWTAPRLLVSAVHPGCVDNRLRAGYGAGCEYDGRVALVHHRGRYLLFTRANLDECQGRGGRFVQVTSSADTVTWSPFSLVAIAEYSPPSGDIYFFAVQTSPTNPDQLIALYPLSQPPRGCICVSFSNDGSRWTRARSLVGCRPKMNGRTDVHPVMGGVVLRDEEVHIYMQEEVSGISFGWQPSKVVRYRLSLQRWMRVVATETAELTEVKGLN